MSCHIANVRRVEYVVDMYVTLINRCFRAVPQYAAILFKSHYVRKLAVFWKHMKTGG